MTPALVSAVIPTHNYAHYLPEAIESVLAQDYAPIEIIVVDNASTDGTRAVVDLYRDRGVIYVRGDGSSPGTARNAGIARARGEFVGFLDADDAWLPGKISAQVAVLEDRPELALVGCWVYECDEANEPTGRRRTPSISGRSAFRKLLVRNFVIPSGVVVRRSLLAEVGGFPDSTFGEDWDLWLRIARRHPIAFVEQPLCKRRVHGAGLTFEIGESILASYAEIGERHLAEVQPSWQRPVLRRRLRSTACYFAAWSAIAEGRPGAGRLAASSIWLDPVTLALPKLGLLTKVLLPDPVYGWLRSVRRRATGALPDRV